MGVVNSVVSAFRRLGLVILIAIAFFFGLATTVYLSLRSPEVTVPEVVGKDRFEAERILANADLNFRVRATRPSNQAQANTVLFQVPRAGEVVKTGQTVAMDISRAAKEGEASEAVVNDKKADEEKAVENRNTNTSETAKNANENRPKRNVNTTTLTKTLTPMRIELAQLLTLRIPIPAEQEQIATRAQAARQIRTITAQAAL